MKPILRPESVKSPHWLTLEKQPEMTSLLLNYPHCPLSVLYGASGCLLCKQLKSLGVRLFWGPRHVPHVEIAPVLVHLAADQTQLLGSWSSDGRTPRMLQTIVLSCNALVMFLLFLTFFLCFVLLSIFLRNSPPPLPLSLADRHAGAEEL